MQPRSPEEQALEVGLLADGQGYPWRPSAHWTLPVKRYLRARHLGWGRHVSWTGGYMTIHPLSTVAY